MYSNKIYNNSKMTILATNLIYLTSTMLHTELKMKILHAIRFFTRHLHNTSSLVKYSLHESL
jgi:hypothetical protein